MKIEIHYFENKADHTVREEYRVFKDGFTYTSKTKSQLTAEEKKADKEQIFHF